MKSMQASIPKLKGKPYCILTLLLICIMLFSGCAQEGEVEPTPGPTATQQPKPLNPTPTPAPVKGGELNIPMPARPQSYHPLFLKESEMSNVYSLIFEPLIALNEKRDAVQCLAENWEYDQEQNVYKIRIRAGVRWHHDNGELTAGDVAFTINTILQNSESFYHTTVAKYIESAQMLDISTVIIRPKIKSYALIYALNIPIIPESYYKDLQADTKAKPIGSGPYWVTNSVYSDNSRIELAVNEQWWKKRPYISSIKAVGYKDNKTAIEAFMKGKLHCVPTDLLTTEVYTTFEGVLDTEYLSRYYDFLAPNLNNDLFKDKRIRQAISYAIDRKHIINTIYLNHAIISEMPLPPDSIFVDTNVNRYDNNAAKAKALLQEAGWELNSDGVLQKGNKIFSFEIAAVDNADDPIRRETARAIAKQLKEYGMEVTVKTYKKNELENLIAEKDFDMVLTGYYLSEMPDFEYIYSSRGAGNVPGYKSSEVDELLTALNNAATKDEYAKASSALQQFISEEVPHIGLFFRLHSLVYRDKLNPTIINRDLTVYESMDKWYFTELDQG